MHELSDKIMAKMADGREYRAIRGGMKTFDDEIKQKEYRVTGHAATFDEYYMLWNDADYSVWEQIDSRAFDACDMADVVMQYDHAGRVFARTSNHTLTVTPDQNGLAVEANLGGTENGRELFEEIRDGYTTKMSIGFRVGEEKREVIEDHTTGKIRINRTITKMAKLYDVSAVSLPANDATEISARSLSDGVIAEVKQERLAMESRAREKQKLALKIRLTEGA